MDNSVIIDGAISVLVANVHESLTHFAATFEVDGTKYKLVVPELIMSWNEGDGNEAYRIYDAVIINEEGMGRTVATFNFVQIGTYSSWYDDAYHTIQKLVRVKEVNLTLKDTFIAELPNGSISLYDSKVTTSGTLDSSCSEFEVVK